METVQRWIDEERKTSPQEGLAVLEMWRRANLEFCARCAGELGFNFPISSCGNDKYHVDCLKKMLSPWAYQEREVGLLIVGRKWGASELSHSAFHSLRAIASYDRGIATHQVRARKRKVQIKRVRGLGRAATCLLLFQL